MSQPQLPISPQSPTTPKKQPDKLTSLPNELLQMIARHLPARAILSLGNANRFTGLACLAPENEVHLSKPIIARETSRLRHEMSYFDFTGLSICNAIHRWTVAYPAPFARADEIGEGLFSFHGLFCGTFVRQNPDVFVDEAEMCGFVQLLLLTDEYLLDPGKQYAESVISNVDPRVGRARSVIWRSAVDEARRCEKFAPLVAQFRIFLPTLQEHVLVQAFRDVQRRPILPLLKVERHPLSAEDEDFVEIPDRWRAKTDLPWDVQGFTPLLGACKEQGRGLVDWFACDDEFEDEECYAWAAILEATVVRWS